MAREAGTVISKMMEYPLVSIQDLIANRVILYAVWSATRKAGLMAQKRVASATQRINKRRDAVGTQKFELQGWSACESGMLLVVVVLLMHHNTIEEQIMAPFFLDEAVHVWKQPGVGVASLGFAGRTPCLGDWSSSCCRPYCSHLVTWFDFGEKSLNRYYEGFKTSTSQSRPS